VSGQGPRARTAFWLTAGTRAWCADSTFAPATMIGWWGSKFLAMIVGVLYPSLESYKALKTETKDDDIQWLAYWIVFALFTLVEFFLDIVLAWIPLYYEVKLVFILWLALPQTRGALKLWQDNQASIDKFYSKMVEQLEKIQAPATAKPPAATGDADKKDD